MSTTIETRPMKKMVVIDFSQTRLYSGRKKLAASDFRIVDGELPPPEFASLGSKKVCNPESLQIFSRLKKRAERAAEKVGVRFMGGYAIPEAKALEVNKELEDIRMEFETAKTAFLSGYDKEVEEWCTKHPDWEQSIRSAVEPVAIVSSKIRFGWAAFRVEPPAEEMGEGLKNMEKGLAGQLFHEIAQMAQVWFDTSLQGKDKVGVKAIRPLRTIRAKLDGLSFLDQKVRPIMDSIDLVLARMPDSGDVASVELSGLLGMALILSDVDRLKKHGEMLMAGQAHDFFVPVMSSPVHQHPKVDLAAKPQIPPVTQNYSQQGAIPGLFIPTLASKSSIPSGMPDLTGLFG